MINTIQTIKNLKETFPRFQIDTILKILECVSEDSIIENGILIEKNRKHVADKTSNKQNIINDGENN